MKISFFKCSLLCKSLQIIAILILIFLVIYIKCFAHVDLTDPTLASEFAKKEIERQEKEYQKQLDRYLNNDNDKDKKEKQERDKRIENGVKIVYLFNGDLKNANMYWISFNNKVYALDSETHQVLDVFYSSNHMNKTAIQKPKYEECLLKIYTNFDKE